MNDECQVRGGIQLVEQILDEGLLTAGTVAQIADDREREGRVGLCGGEHAKRFRGSLLARGWGLGCYRHDRREQGETSYKGHESAHVPPQTIQ